MLESTTVNEIELMSEELVTKLMSLSERERVSLLDSCGVGHLGAHLVIAGIRPVEEFDLSDTDPADTLRLLDEKLSGDLAAIFTISYDFGVKLQCVVGRAGRPKLAEPDLHIALFDALVIHDYDTGKTFVAGHNSGGDRLANVLRETANLSANDSGFLSPSQITSNFTRSEYVAAVERIREHIRAGDTYQTNLTQQLKVGLGSGSSPQTLFRRLRRDHPAPFAAYIRRPGSTVVSASPERFLRVRRDRSIETSPIKGTRPRGITAADDARLREELVSSAKDRAENTMIVDLMRNDLGRVCDFGSVTVEKLCDVEEHPTLFHLVSTIRGQLRPAVRFSEILRAVFPCGSITGAPKLRTMQLIDKIEMTNRGLSMGAIGVYLPASWDFGGLKIDTIFDLSVAIRTMVVRDGEAVFNVGGGVVIDSDPEKEFDESMLKARALLNALGAGSDYKSGN